VWTVVGSVAGVAAVAVALGAWAVQARSARKHPPLGADDILRVTLEPDGDADDRAKVQRAEDQATGPGVTQSGWLRFVAVSLADTTYWSEVPVGDDYRSRVFERKPAQYFRIDFKKDFVYNPRLIFDITILNRSASQPLVLREVGVRWTALCKILYVYGIPEAAKIKRDGEYVIVCHPEKFQSALPISDADVWGEGGPVDTTVDESVLLPDPIYLEPDAPFRFSLELKDYTSAVPNHALIRFWLRSEPGIDWSPEIELFTI
jgi:hypothetical protein